MLQREVIGYWCSSCCRRGTQLCSISVQQGGQSSAAPQESKLPSFCCTCLLLPLWRMSGAGKSSIAGLGFAEVFKSNLKVVFIAMEENKG